MTYTPLFITNTARSGSYLIGMMLSANDEVMVASEPYLELYRSFRNAAVRHNAAWVSPTFNPKAPIQDYYFRDDQLAVLDAIQAAPLDLPFDQTEWPAFVEALVPRLSLQCAELAPLAHELRGETYREMFDHALEIVAKARNAANRKWLGIKDAWTIEFFRPQARAYPDAKFITIVRDPRAVLNSMLGIVRIDPTQVGQVLSYLRHWRKMIAFHHAFEADPLFAGRLFMVRHEDVVHKPERTCRGLCEFLDVPFQERMLDTNAYLDYSTGDVWKGNSSFETETRGISAERAERWKTMLADEIVAVAELMCGPEMESCGYELRDPGLGLAGPTSWPQPAILEYLFRAAGEYTNWRTDLGDLQQDFGYELFRRALLTLENRDHVDTNVLRRSYLLEAAYKRLLAERVKRCRGASRAAKGAEAREAVAARC